MTTHGGLLIASIAVALYVSALCAALACYRLAQRFVPSRKPRYHAKPNLYEDEDGIATQESEASYSYQVQRILVFVFSFVGWITSFLGSILRSQHGQMGGGRLGGKIEPWLCFGMWVGIPFVVSIRLSG